jgi:hypothetical protein
MKKQHSIAVLTLAGLLACTAASVQAQRPAYGENSIRISAGLFQPDGESVYWDDSFATFTGRVEDFEDLQLQVEYQRQIGGRLSFVVGVGGYEGSEDLSYLDFVDTQGFDIFHNTRLEVENISLGLRLDLAPPRAPVQPYIAGGGGFFAWQLEESGEFIDFNVIPEEIFNTDFYDEGEAFGYYWAVGLDVPLGRSFTVFAEARWTDAKDDLAGDFEGLGELDLSGQRIAGGFSWRF